MSEENQQEDEFVNDMRSLLDEIGDYDSDDSLSAPLFNNLAGIEKRYTDLKLIAEGGMKRIFNAFDQCADKRVALALLHEETPVELYDSFIREARLTALLEHPNIISIFDIGVEGEKPYFAMELKGEQTLKGAVRRSSPEERRSLLEIFLKV